MAKDAKKKPHYVNNKEFYERNDILKTQSNVEEYLSGNKDVDLDIIQKAYIDALKK